MKLINRRWIIALMLVFVLGGAGCEGEDEDSYSSNPSYNDPPYQNTTRRIQVHVFNGSYGYVDQFGFWTGMVLVEIEKAPYANLRPGESTYVPKDLYSHDDKLVLHFTEQASGMVWEVAFGDRYQYYSVTLHGDGRPPTLEPPP